MRERFIFIKVAGLNPATVLKKIELLHSKFQGF